MPEIKTDNRPRRLRCLAELPKDKAKDFDYLGTDEEFYMRFILFRGEYYDVYDTVFTGGGDSQFKKWDSALTDTFFSGLLFRFCENKYGNAAVIVGRYFC